MDRHWDLQRLAREWSHRQLDRRELMQLIGAGAGLAALTTLAAAGPAGAQETGTKVSIQWKKPRTLGPLFSTAGSEQQVERLIFGALVKMTDKLEQVGDLAEKVEAAADAKTFTFHLHPNATFNDGTPLTAQDVIFTLQAAIDKRTGAYWQGRLMGITGAAAYSTQQATSVSGLTAPDDHTVVIALDKPDAAFLPTLADFTGLGILPKHVLEKVAPDQLINDPFNLAPKVGAGPYSFVQYQTDQFLELAPNPKFWGDKPKVDHLFLRIVQPDIAVAELEKGTLDLISISIDDIERLKKNPNLTVVSVPSPSMDSISVNLDKPYFKDVRLRQAMMYAIDRATIVKEIFQGLATVTNSPIFGPAWMGVPEVNAYAYDPDKARQLVKESGWDSSRSVQMMYVPGSNRTFDNMVPIVQGQLGDAGIKVELLQLDAAGLNQKLITDHDYDLYIGGGGVYGADPGICAKYYLSTNLAPAGANNTRYVNPKIDDLFAQGRQASDQAARKAIYQQIAGILNTDLPSIFLWSPYTNFAFSSRLLGFQPPSYVDNRVWNAETWSVKAG